MIKKPFERWNTMLEPGQIKRLVDQRKYGVKAQPSTAPEIKEADEGKGSTKSSSAASSGHNQKSHGHLLWTNPTKIEVPRAKARQR